MMKQLIIFAILACVCMVRSAPPSSSSARQLIVPNYDDEVAVTEDSDDENYEADLLTTTTTTTTTKTTRRSPFAFPSRTRESITTRRRTRVPTTSTSSSINVDDVMNEYENSNYNGDFRYFRNIREFVKRILEDLKKFIQNLNIADIIKIIQRFFNRGEED